MQTVTDANSVSASQTFDTLGRIASQTIPDGTKLLLTYTFCSGVNGGSASCPTYGAYLMTAQTYASNGTTPIGPLTNTYYDALGREIANDEQGFDGSNIRVATQYDANERLSQKSRSYFTATCSGSCIKWTTYLYDALGRVTQETSPDTSYSTFAYHGLVKSVTNALSQTTTTELNPQGLVKTITDALLKQTGYTYDAFDDLATVTDPLNNVLSNSYDVRGRKIATSDRDMGSWTYSYDVLSELKSQTDAKSQVTSLSYDVLGRPSERKDVAGAGFVYANWIYDSGAHAIGRLSTACTSNTSNPSCTAPISQRALTYDAKGRPSAATLTIGGTNYVYTSTYDATNGQVATTTYPSGFVALNAYNARGFISSVKQNGTSNVYWTLNALDADMHATSQTAGNGITTTQVFDANTGRVSSITAGTGNAIANWSYQWDAVGNLTKRTDDNPTINTKEFFCYDSLNRLTNYAISTTASSCTSAGTKTVAYNEIGNITSKSDSGGAYNYPASGASSVRPHGVSSVTGTVYGIANPKFDYDANGNMICIHQAGTCTSPYRTVTWTSFNMADTVTQGSTTVTLAYDDTHTRITQTATSSGVTTTTTYLNDPISGATSIKTVSGGITTWREYIVGINGIVAERDTAGGSTTLQYFVLDHLASVGSITDGSGGLVQRLSYDPWGKRRNSNGTDDPSCSITSNTTRGFINQEEIDPLCSVNLNARLYDPVIAKFMSPDPTIPSISEGQTLNHYSYATNNPLALRDPSGLGGFADSNSLSECREGMSSCNHIISGDPSNIKIRFIDGDGNVLGECRGASCGPLAAQIFNSFLSQGFTGATFTNATTGASVTMLGHIGFGSGSDSFFAAGSQGYTIDTAVVTAGSASYFIDKIALNGGPTSDQIPLRMTVLTRDQELNFTQYHYGLTTKGGDLLTGLGFRGQEHITIVEHTGQDVLTNANGTDFPIDKGVHFDIVGVHTFEPLPTDLNTYYRYEQKFSVTFYGVPIPVSTVFEHEVNIENGIVTAATTKTLHE